MYICRYVYVDYKYIYIKVYIFIRIETIPLTFGKYRVITCTRGSANIGSTLRSTNQFPIITRNTFVIDQLPVEPTHSFTLYTYI